MNNLFLCVFVECSYFKIKWSDILEGLRMAFRNTNYWVLPSEIWNQ